MNTKIYFFSWENRSIMKNKIKNWEEGWDDRGQIQCGMHAFE
jgi:hypothetical protein